MASAAPTPAPSSPPPSESLFSDIDGASVVDSLDAYTFVPPTDPAALNLVSWKLDVNARAEDGVEKRGFNAISTVLNHPTKKANPLRSSRKPLPPLTQQPPALPKPPPSGHYDAYLKAVTPLYDGLVAAQEPGRRAQSERNVPDLPPLDSVPDLFFETSFDLSNPSTWAAVIISAESTPRHTQDALSSHLDTLEAHLVHEITLRSTSFFSALSNLQDLHSESSSCLSRISELQDSLKQVGQNQARTGLQVIDAQEQLRVLRDTEQGVRSMSELEELVKVTKGLVEAGDWSGALGCVQDVVRWWGRHTLEASQTDDQPGPSRRPLPLTSLPSLSSLPSDLASVVTAIATQLEAALHDRLLGIMSGADTEGAFDEEGFRRETQPIIVGLARCGKMDGVEDVWRDVTTMSIRDGSRKHLPISSTDDEAADGKPPEARGTNLADSLKSMSHSQFLHLSAQMYGVILERLKTAEQMGTSLLTLATESSTVPILSISASPDPIPSRSDAAPPIDISDVLSSACELANSRASKILSVRSEQHAALKINEFVEVFKENYDFVQATESLAKRTLVSLRGVTASQARAFLIAYHSLRLTRSAKLVEEEQWTQVDVSGEVQHVVNLLIKAAVEDPKECFIPAPTDLTNGHADEGGKTLDIEDKSFFVVKATAESLGLLGDYLKVVINLELVVTDVMGRIIEFLKSFNSRTCQVVLGAGAMRSAGLKNITAKHLALASQSLSIIIALTPYIREFIRRHLSQKQAVMLTEFDKLKRDYQDHQNEIHAKLVAIMSDRLAVHVGSLRALDWEASSASQGTNEYAEMLVKETATLHKVLSKYLSSQTVESVMSEVLAAITHRLAEEYGKIELKSEGAKARMLADVTLIVSKLGPLSEAGKSVGSLETVVKDKPVPKKTMGEGLKGMFGKKQKEDAKVEEKPPAGGRTEPNGEVVDELVDEDEKAEEKEVKEEEVTNSPVDSIKVADPEKPVEQPPVEPIPEKTVEQPPPEPPKPADAPSPAPPLPEKAEKAEQPGKDGPATVTPTKTSLAERLAASLEKSKRSLDSVSSPTRNGSPSPSIPPAPVVPPKADVPSPAVVAEPETLDAMDAVDARPVDAVEALEVVVDTGATAVPLESASVEAESSAAAPPSVITSPPPAATSTPPAATSPPPAATSPPPTTQDETQPGEPETADITAA